MRGGRGARAAPRALPRAPLRRPQRRPPPVHLHMRQQHETVASEPATLEVGSGETNQLGRSKQFDGTLWRFEPSQSGI